MNMRAPMLEASRRALRLGRCLRARRALTVLVAAACSGLGLGLLAQAPSASSQERDRAGAVSRRASERIQALQREADALAARERTLLRTLRKLELQRQISVEQLAAFERDRVEIQRRLQEAEARAASLARTAEVQLPEVEARLVQLYKMGRAGYWQLLLNVEDLQALGRAYRTASTLMAMDRARIAEHYATLDALARERRTLQEREDELQRLHGEALKARAAADKAVAERTALVTAIDARRDLNAQLIGELQAAQQRLQGSLSQMGTGKALPGLPLKAFQGDLPWPAPGRVLRPFGGASVGPLGNAALRNGVELSAAEGQPVRSVHEGIVAYADPFEGYGTLVIVDHGSGSYSLYGYLSTVRVSRGARVEGQGVVGTAGRSPNGNPSLYFELRVDGVPVDPLQWLHPRR